MNPSRALKVVVAVLIIALLTTFGFLLQLRWQMDASGGWKDQIFILSGALASRRATDDFKSGKLRLLRLEGKSNSLKFTGRKEGPYEIWTPQFNPALGEAHRYATEQYVEIYNQKMKDMHDHPEKYVVKAVAEPPPKKGTRKK